MSNAACQFSQGYPIFVLVRFHRWGDILKLGAPNPNLTMTAAFWHFSRGSAFAAKGEIALAETEQKTLLARRNQTPPEVEFSFYFNKARTFLDLAVEVLDARIAAAKGDPRLAITHWK